MNKDYVIVNIKTNGEFDRDDNTQITLIEAIKLNNDLKVLDKIEISNKINEKDIIIEFINFCTNSNLITYNSNYTLSFILKALYKNKITNNIRFKYIDLKDIIEEAQDIPNTLNYLKEYLENNNINTLEELFLSMPFHGRVFRGLNYPKYLCDIKIDNSKFYGYIVDPTSDKYISYYSFLRELNGEYFSIEDITKLKSLGAKIILNISYLSEESLLFTDCYSIQAVKENIVTKDSYRLIDKINHFINNKEKYNNVKLVLWGSIDVLKDTYMILDKNVLEEVISSINIIKGPWDKWTDTDINILENK